MAISIGIFDVEEFNLDEELEKRRSVSLRSDKMANLHEFQDTGLPPPETIIKRKGTNVYAVEHFSDTIKKPIRTWSEYTFIDAGYQEHHKFEMIFDPEEKELFIINVKSVVKEVYHRIKSHPHLLKIKKRKFKLDFSQIPEILTAYGIWNQVEEANIKCKALFGANVLDTEHVGEETIAINMKVKINGKELDITLTREGQISSQSKAQPRDLIDFYKKIKKDIIVEEASS